MVVPITTESFYDLLKRPEITIKFLKNFTEIPFADDTLEEIEIMLKYEGYITRERLIAEKLQRLENIKIKGKFDYKNIASLSTEARQKLTRIDPETIAQAGRISGVSPSDINILLVLLGR